MTTHARRPGFRLALAGLLVTCWVVFDAERLGLTAASAQDPIQTVDPSAKTVTVTQAIGQPGADPVGGTGVRESRSKKLDVGRAGLLRMLARANPMLWLLVVCSIVTLGYSLERLLALRRDRVIPREFVQRFLERLAGGKLDRERAVELCRANDSPAARIFALIVSDWGQPAASIRQRIGYDAAGELGDLKRNVRVLNGTATLAPLLGLLGTVIGMIQSFEALGGKVGPARAEALAQGISLALVATAFGLSIAVVSVTAYYFLLNRVDLLVRALDEEARRVIDLVSAEALRPHSLIVDRRAGGAIPPPNSNVPSAAVDRDPLTRHESRIHG